MRAEHGFLPSSAVRELARRLDRALGPQGWWPAKTPFEVMVGAILTQNTNWKNVERAISNLEASGVLSPEAITGLPPDRLAELIRPAGYFRVKSRRLREFCNWLLLRSEALEDMPTAELREELLSVSGVGPETADSILLYALGRPVFVVDAYTRRIFTRHGLIHGDEPYDEIRAGVERAIRGPRRVRRFNELHAQIVEVGKRFCRTEPICEGCPLEGWEVRPPRTKANPVRSR